MKWHRAHEVSQRSKLSLVTCLCRNADSSAHPARPRLPHACPTARPGRPARQREPWARLHAAGSRRWSVPSRPPGDGPAATGSGLSPPCVPATHSRLRRRPQSPVPTAWPRSGRRSRAAHGTQRSASLTRPPARCEGRGSGPTRWTGTGQGCGDTSRPRPLDSPSPVSPTGSSQSRPAGRLWALRRD